MEDRTVSIKRNFYPRAGFKPFSFTHEIQTHLRRNIGTTCLLHSEPMILRPPSVSTLFAIIHIPPSQLPVKLLKVIDNWGLPVLKKTYGLHRRAFPAHSSERQIQNNDAFLLECRPVIFEAFTTDASLSNADAYGQQINANLLNIYVPPRRRWPRNIFPLFYPAVSILDSAGTDYSDVCYGSPRIRLKNRPFYICIWGVSKTARATSLDGSCAKIIRKARTIVFSFVFEVERLSCLPASLHIIFCVTERARIRAVHLFLFIYVALLIFICFEHFGVDLMISEFLGLQVVAFCFYK